MAHKTLLTFPASAMFGDEDQQLEAGDAPAPPDRFKGRPVLTFDDDDPEAAITPVVVMPQGLGGYNGGTLKADIHYFTDGGTGNLDYEVFVEAATPDSDTLDMEGSVGWDSANAVTDAVVGVQTYPRVATVTLTNKDGVAAGDIVRFGIRRDADDGVNDTVVGDVRLHSLEIWEDA
jgi:hypothetical protein